MELSKRLLAVVNMLDIEEKVCDIGCDHGYVSIYLIRTNKCKKVIAVDVNQGPLRRAVENVEAYGLTKYIDIRLSNGLSSVLQGEVDSVICAGMGGRTIQTILLDSLDKVKNLKSLILQPQSEVQQLREFLILHKFQIVNEDMVLEDGKFYPMIKCIPKKEQEDVFDVIQLKYGPILLQKKHPILLEYLKLEEIKFQQLLEHIMPNAIKYNKLEAELRTIKQAINLMQ